MQYVVHLGWYPRYNSSRLVLTAKIPSLRQGKSASPNRENVTNFEHNEQRQH